MFYNKQEKQIWVFQLWKIAFKFSAFTFSFGFLKREWNRITSVLISVCYVNKCNSFWILCIFWCFKPMSVVCSWGCQDQHSWCVLCQRKCVSWRVQAHFFGGFGVIYIWLLGGLLSGFWGLDVALGLRVNQYKLFVYLFLPLNSFKLSFYWFDGINNRLFQRNNRLFFWCFAVLCFISWLTEFVIEFHTKDFVLA